MNELRLDFVVVGAPKCGTTSLYRYLSANPGIFMPYVKEPHFFCSDLSGLARVKTLKEYEALFDGARDDQLKGEASATYLFSSAATSNIMAHSPDVKIIVMMRNPVEAVQSYHKQLLTGLLEDIPDFETAWRAQDDRAKGRNLPRHCPAPPILQYGATFAFAEQLARIIAVVPPQQRHFIVFEEFFADPASHYARLLQFLGAPPQGDVDFSVFNPATKLRSRAFARFYLSPPRLAMRLWSPFRMAMHRLGIIPSVIMENLNSTPAPKTTISPEMRAELKAYYAKDVAAVEGLLGRSLPAWR